MNILYITPYFSFRQGGVSEVVYQLATHLTNRGHDVTLLTSDYLAEDESNIETIFNIVRLPSLSRWGFYVIPRMMKWLKKNLSSYDLVHLHEFRTFQNIIASYFAHNASTPFFLTAHGTVPNIIEKRILKSLYDLIFIRRIFQSIDMYIAVSPKEVEDYLKVGIDQKFIIQIYNGLDIEEFINLNRSNLYRNPGSWNNDIQILYLGRLHKLKRIDLLIIAYSKILKKYPKVKLVIAGPDNGELNNLKKQAQSLGIDHLISFPGPIYGDNKIALYQSSTLVAYPSSNEVFGLVPFEALLSGTPIVVTEDTGMGEIISQAKAGKIISQNDPEALAEAIFWVLENPDLAQCQVKAGQKFIRENLDWNTIVQQHECIYQHAIKRHAIQDD